MIIDKKGRIFGKVNIVDLTVLAIFILAIFISVKFIFFKPNFFHYKNMTIEASFRDVPLNDLMRLSKGKNQLYSDNESYLFLDEEEFAECYGKIKTIKLIYYFNDSYSIQLSNYTIRQGKNASDTHYFNGPVPDTEEYICTAIFLFKLGARIIDGEPLYKEYGYHLSKGRPFEASFEYFALNNGETVAVYDSFYGGLKNHEKRIAEEIK